MVAICMRANARPFMVAGKRIEAGATFDCELAIAADLTVQGRASPVTDDDTAAVARYRKEERETLDRRLEIESRRNAFRVA